HAEDIDEVGDRLVERARLRRGRIDLVVDVEGGDLLAVEDDAALRSVAVGRVHPQAVGSAYRDDARLAELELLPPVLDDVVGDIERDAELLGAGEKVAHAFDAL